MTTTTKTQLLQAIISNPDEDTPRLVYADYLQENGEEDEAEYIRTAIQWYNLTTVVMGEQNALEILKSREGATYIAHTVGAQDSVHWIHPNRMFGLPKSIYGKDIVVHKGLDTHYTMEDIREYGHGESAIVRLDLEEMEKERHAKTLFTTKDFNYLAGNNTEPQRWATWERGFISEVRLNGNEFLQLAPMMLWDGKGLCSEEAHPVRKVTLRSVPDMKYNLRTRDNPTYSIQCLSLSCEVLGKRFAVDQHINNVGRIDTRYMETATRILYEQLSPKKVLGMIYPNVEFVIPTVGYPNENTEYIPNPNYLAAVQDYEQWSDGIVEDGAS